MQKPNAIIIRRAVETDLPLILEFVRELAEYEKLLDSVTTTEDRLRAALFGSEAIAEAILAYQDHEPIAFALYYFNYSSFSGLPGLYLEDIFVRPKARGGGIGRDIFVWLSERAAERGCGRMEWAVLDWNKAAIGFYENLGAKPLEGWTIFRLAREQFKDLKTEGSD